MKFSTKENILKWVGLVMATIGVFLYRELILGWHHLSWVQIAFGYCMYFKPEIFAEILFKKDE